MIDILQTQVFQLVAPQSLNGAEGTSTYVDTQNVDWVRVVFGFGVIGAVDTGVAVVTECATSGGSYTSITGSGATLLNTDDGTIIITDVDYRNKGSHLRFLKASFTAGAAATLAYALAIVQPKLTPTSISNVGAGWDGTTVIAVKAWNQV
jgi:hypothetical protein